MKCCRAMRARLAPSARRTAISFCRDVERARSKLATLAQAIRSTTPTMHMRTTSGVENCVRMSEMPCPGRQHFEMFADEPLAKGLGRVGNGLDLILVNGLVQTTLSCTSAASAVTPGLRWPMIVTHRLRRLSRSFQVGVICAFIIIGTTTSLFEPTWMPLNPAADTPTIVIGWPLTTMVRSRTAGSPPKTPLPEAVAEHGDGMRSRL